VSQRLLAERPCLVDDRFRPGFVQRDLEQRQVIVELEHDAPMVAGTRKPPDALGDLLCGDSHGWWSWSRGSFHAFWRG
jgi:hypothetical protein